MLGDLIEYGEEYLCRTGGKLEIGYKNGSENVSPEILQVLSHLWNACLGMLAPLHLQSLVFREVR